MFYEIFVHNLQFIYKIQFHRWKPVDPPLAVSEVRQMLSWWRHINKCIAIEYLSITCRGGFIQRLQCMPGKEIQTKSTFFCYWKFFFYSFSQLVELLFLCDVTDIIRPRLLIACLNNAAYIFEQSKKMNRRI